MISSGGLTDRLRRLQNAGLIQRGAPDGDARSLLVELTREGRRRADAAFRKDMELEAKLLAGLGQSELKSLDGLLRKLVLSLDER